MGQELIMKLKEVKQALWILTYMEKNGKSARKF